MRPVGAARRGRRTLAEAPLCSRTQGLRPSPAPEHVLFKWAKSVMFRGAPRTSCGLRARREECPAQDGEDQSFRTSWRRRAIAKNWARRRAWKRAPGRVPRSIVRSSASRPSGLRVALVHDWLTGMRGGEKCLEVLCQAFPDATLHTLIHRRGALSPAIEAMAIRTSPLQRVPGVFRHYRQLLPLMPLAARTWRSGEVDLVVSLSHCVAKAVRVPAGVPHVCYCFTPMRYAWQGRDAYLDGWSDRPVRRALAGRLLDRLRAWDRATAARVTHFVAISETVRERIARCYGRESRVIPPPVDTEFYTPDAAALATAPTSASRRWCRTSGSSTR